MMFSLTSLRNPDAFKRENLNTSLQSCRDSKASYYKIIVYSFSRHISRTSVPFSQLRF